MSKPSGSTQTPVDDDDKQDYDETSPLLGQPQQNNKTTSPKMPSSSQETDTSKGASSDSQTRPDSSQKPTAVVGDDQPASQPKSAPGQQNKGTTSTKRSAPAVVKSDTDLSWGQPAGLPIRRTNDENLVIFRRAVGINSTLPGSTDCRSLEEGRKSAMGMYAAAMRAQRNKKLISRLVNLIVYASHFFQIIVGASLTALGPSAGEHAVLITVLGAVNTVIAGVLALLKGQGLPERLRHQVAEFRKLQDWIEQTEALLSVGVIGRDRKEVGLLVQVAFKKYNAAKECEESTSQPEYNSNGYGNGNGYDDHDHSESSEPRRRPRLSDAGPS
ncbi:hypothetical protein QBC40DRAFT_76594 [Triangularia verruculosa]|uniref:SMODS and SLOG-associating 2TM effector domain-containing protein n=1 Tax=Triangularia verruculosa TaxID=2587418 RepID=A0AAN6XFU1_9PEZI|nr:hypothetical protein QBC40DRAFT_76594 [Triangularia verruculosa]